MKFVMQFTRRAFLCGLIAFALVTGLHAADSITVCSWNIQFLGSSKVRDNQALAHLVRDYDIVVVQELVASPQDPIPNRELGSPQRAMQFFDAMHKLGFKHVLSESDTGVSKKPGVFNNGNATEWFVTFYKEDAVLPAADLPHGFIGAPLGQNPTFDRVPYAFAFRSINGNTDFVLISVHLNPEKASRRKAELKGIADWINTMHTKYTERDLIIIGDMNLQSIAEVRATAPVNYISLNDACVSTVTNTIPKPYDHVMFNPVTSTEIDRSYGFKVLDLVEVMRPNWRGPGSYPGGPPYRHDPFRAVYSDHQPVVFRINVLSKDDD